ncbi:unnamed protein product [Dibothriocephalus latus]|uniref:Uncharacterized protein n=1 Tax=Dibothriocephalus latus TaxID=60516 RepID=A0A3P7NH44_DIBLA|nr:unnamed protein product [Dibothriocephalus latus]
MIWCYVFGVMDHSCEVIRFLGTFPSQHLLRLLFPINDHNRYREFNQSSKVLHLRANYEELLRILNNEERGLFRVAEKMSDFLLQNQITPSANDSTNVLSQLVCNPLAYNPFTAEQWSVAVRCFSDRIRPAEEAAIPYLRNYLATAAQKCRFHFV